MNRLEMQTFVEQVVRQHVGRYNKPQGFCDYPPAIPPPAVYTSNLHPLKLVTHSDGIRVVNGTISGYLADLTMDENPFVILLDDLVYAHNWIVAAMPTAWDVNNVYNDIVDDGVITVEDGALPVGDDDWAYCLIGIVYVSGGEITGITQSVSGSQVLERSGKPGEIIQTRFVLS